MSARYSVRVANNLKTTAFLASAAEVHGATVAGAVGERAPEIGAGLGGTVIAALGATVRRAGGDLDRAELAYSAELADDVAPREARDLAYAVAFRTASRARSAVEAGLGADGLAKYGLVGATPTDAAQLVGALAATIKLLNDNPLVQEDAVAGVFDSARLANALDAVRAPLVAALEAVNQETREAQAALVVRDRALVAWQQVYVGVGAALEGLFRLGAMTELADRLRPTARKVTGEEAAGPGPGPGPEG